ncbi:hypothetical protein ABIA96_006270 [Bradyrhizobium sp. LB11.1]
MPRLDRGIQYAAASRFNHCRLWNTGSPAFAGDDTFRGSARPSRPPLNQNRRVPSGMRRLVMPRTSDQLLRRPSAARFHWETLSAIMRVDFIAAWLSWA